MAQGAFFLPSLLSGGGTSSTGASTSAQAQAAMLSSLFGLSPTSPPTSSAATNVNKINEYAEDVLNLSTKKQPSSSNSSTSQPSTSGIPASTNFLNSLNFTELFALANLPPGELRTYIFNFQLSSELKDEFRT